MGINEEIAAAELCPIIARAGKLRMLWQESELGSERMEAVEAAVVRALPDATILPHPARARAMEMLWQATRRGSPAEAAVEAADRMEDTP